MFDGLFEYMQNREIADAIYVRLVEKEDAGPPASDESLPMEKRRRWGWGRNGGKGTMTRSAAVSACR